MTIVAIIPARSGSKSVKDKNLLRLENRTLLEWSIMAAKKSKMVDEVVVSTDSSLYAEIATSAGASVPFLRPKELSRDRSTDSEFVFHILSQLKEKDHYPEYFIHLRPTTPLRIPSIIDEAIETFIGSNFTSLRQVVFTDLGTKIFLYLNQQALNFCATQENLKMLNNLS